MDYSLYVLTPKNTAQSSPLVSTLKLSRGEIYGGWLYFPYGPAGTLHAQIWHRDIQLAPFNRGASYNLDDAVIRLSIRQFLHDPPYTIDLVTWNTSTNTDHALNFGIWLRPYPHIQDNIQLEN